MRYLFLLTLVLAACSQVPAPPTPVPSPSEVPASPSPEPSPLFRLVLGSDNQPDSDYLVAVIDAAAAWEDATHLVLFSWLDGRQVVLFQFPRIDSGLTDADKATGAITYRNKGVVIFSGQVPVKMRRTVATHEFGHLIGLKHSTDPSSVMYPVSSNQTITPDDAANAIRVLSSP